MVLETTRKEVSELKWALTHAGDPSPAVSKMLLRKLKFYAGTAWTLFKQVALAFVSAYLMMSSKQFTVAQVTLATLMIFGLIAVNNVNNNLKRLQKGRK